MTYSCTDFTDTIIDALGVDIPECANESPSDQADICLEEIGRLQVADAICKALANLAGDDAPSDFAALISRAKCNVRVNAAATRIVQEAEEDEGEGDEEDED